MEVAAASWIRRPRIQIRRVTRESRLLLLSLGAVEVMNFARGGRRWRLSCRFDLRLDACYSIEISPVVEQHTKAGCMDVAVCEIQ